ncbi:MAG: 30S ribosomal protein S8e [Methanomicrobiales archaeon]|nr:30S ribosomal protein S8e [Methanomicrobiales archaeon]
MLWQGRSIRRSTGGRIHPARGKKAFEIGRASADTTIGPSHCSIIRTFGGNCKVRALRMNVASVSDPKTGVTRKAMIETVIENRADPNYVRRNILTRGAIIKTDLGKARVVNRPGQSGVINAVLIE